MMMAGSVLSASDKLMTAASSGNTELVLQLLANSSTLSLEHDEVLCPLQPLHTHKHASLMAYSR